MSFFWDIDSGEDERGAAVALYAVVQGVRVKHEPPRFTPSLPAALSAVTPFPVSMATNTPIAEFDVVHFPTLSTTPESSDLSQHYTTANMGKAIETPSNTGFTPLIEQQERFESFKSTQSRKFHSEKQIHSEQQGIFSIFKLDPSSTLLTSSSDHTSGLLLVASADIVLEKTRYVTINNEFQTTVEKSFRSETIEKHQKQIVYEIVDYKKEKELRSIIKNTTTWGEESRVLHLASSGSKQYRPRKSLPKTFPKFGGLPIELRYKIWGMVVPTDRVVEFTVRGEKREVFKPRKTSVPAVLQACYESRQVALKTLKPMFHTIAKADAYNYFNASTDVLQLSLKSAQKLALTHDDYANRDRELIQHLQIPCHIDPKDPFMADAIATLIVRAPHRSWGSLQTLFLSGREKREKKHVIQYRVDLPEDWEGANAKIVPFAKKIEKRLKQAVEKYGRRVDIAIFIQYG